MVLLRRRLWPPLVASFIEVLAGLGHPAKKAGMMAATAPKFGFPVKG
jgi:hypothetical protein